MVTHGIIQALGGRAVFGSEPSSATEWDDRIQAGLPYACAAALKDTLGLTHAELAAVMGLSPAALTRLASAASTVDAVRGDRLVRAARLYSIAAEVLEAFLGRMELGVYT